MKRDLLKKPKTSLQKIVIAFRNLLKQKKQEYCHIIYEESFNVYRALHLMIWFELSPSHSTLWWIWIALGISGHFSVHSMLLSVWNTDVSHFPAVDSVSGLTVSVRSSWRCLVFLGLKIWNAVGAKIRFFMDRCFFCSIFKIICLLVHQFLRTFWSVYITYNFEQKFHASAVHFLRNLEWNEKGGKRKTFLWINFKNN